MSEITFERGNKPSKAGLYAAYVGYPFGEWIIVAWLNGWHRRINDHHVDGHYFENIRGFVGPLPTPGRDDV